MEHPGTMTHSDIRPSGSRDGITPAMVRISVGLEHPTDIIADLAQALEAILSLRTAASRRPAAGNRHSGRASEKGDHFRA